MRKLNCHIKCSCGSNNVVKSGYDSKHRQRYKCNDCNIVFTRNQKYPRTSSTKRAIGILYNLMRNNFYNEISIIEALEKASKDNVLKQIKNVLYDKFKVSSSTEETILFSNVNKPKIIIGADDNNKLYFYKVPEHISNKKCKVYIQEQ